MNLLTAEQLLRIMPNAQKRVELFIDPLNKAMLEFGITTPIRQAAFLAQIAHESGELNYTAEIASGAAYDHRSDLGNTCSSAIEQAKEHNTTAGKLYKGRGLIQLTGFYNYADCSRVLNLDIVRDPTLLSTPENSSRSAAWFWWSHRLNELADQNKFREITKRINGGYNGMAQRLTFYGLAKSVLGININN